jgi:hypothetical protein
MLNACVSLWNVGWAESQMNGEKNRKTAELVVAGDRTESGIN